MISRRRLLAGASLAGAGALLSPHSRAAETPPNILFILVDQLNDLAWLDDSVHAPNLRRLMAEGTRFSNSYCSSPTCSPARSSLFTGRYCSETGVLLNGVPMSAELPDVGVWLREQGGYDSLYLGKWHVPGWRVMDSFKLTTMGHLIGLQGDLPLAAITRATLNQRTSKTPFFMTVSLLNPHDICSWIKGGSGGLTAEDIGVDPAELPPLPSNFEARPQESALFTRVKRDRGFTMSPEFTRLFRWYYHRYIEVVDGVLGSVLEALAESRWPDNTVVCLTSDHGEGEGYHGLKFKSSLYEAASTVPMLLHGPGRIPKGQVVEAPIDATSVAPTLCELAGVPSLPGCLAPSLLPMLDGGVGRGFAASQNLVEGRMIRTASYKYVAYRGDEAEQFFHLDEDPLETLNLLGDSAHASALQDHRRLLSDWEASLVNVPEAAKSYAEVARKGSDEE